MKNVLLVDDDATIRRIAEISLSRIGKLNVNTCESGSKALEFLLDNRPDVILLDVMMPGMDGVTVLKSIQEMEHLSGVPVIFMTAKVQKHEMQSYFDLGVSGVITKPFDPVGLPVELRRIYDRSCTTRCVA